MRTVDDTAVCECLYNDVSLLAEVCASDGRTYSSFASVQHASCRHGLPLTVKHEKSCGK